MTAHQYEVENGSSVYLKTDYSVISKVCNKFNYKLQEFTQALEYPEQMTFLFFESLNRGFKVEGKTHNYTIDDAENLLGELYAEFLESFNKDCLDMALTRKQKLEIENKKKANQNQ